MNKYIITVIIIIMGLLLWDVRNDCQQCEQAGGRMISGHCLDVEVIEY